MSPKDNVQLIVSIKKRLIGYFIEARIINQYFLNDISIIYFKRILRKKTIRDLEQGNQLILGNNQIFTNGFIRQEKSSVNLYVNSIELKKYKLSAIRFYSGGRFFMSPSDIVCGFLSV